MHLYDEAGYVDKLLGMMDELGVEKCCMSGLGELFGFGDDKDVKAAFEAYSDRFVGAVYVRPGVDGVEKIDWAYESGFRIVKVTLPKKGYEESEYFPLWERVLQFGMPVLFHTGIVACKDVCGEGISSWNMHPMRIEPITREFPELNVIVAHMGVHWNNEAADLARMRANVYVDITGEPGGWRDRLDIEGLDKYLWWEGAFEKVVYGTDVHCEKMGLVLRQDMERLEKLGVSEETKAKIFSGNILRLLGL